jgi:hypothetical protein
VHDLPVLKFDLEMMTDPAAFGQLRTIQPVRFAIQSLNDSYIALKSLHNRVYNVFTHGKLLTGYSIVISIQSVRIQLRSASRLKKGLRFSMGRK